MNPIELAAECERHGLDWSFTHDWVGATCTRCTTKIDSPWGRFVCTEQEWGTFEPRHVYDMAYGQVLLARKS